MWKLPKFPMPFSRKWNQLSMRNKALGEHGLHDLAAKSGSDACCCWCSELEDVRGWFKEMEGVHAVLLRTQTRIRLNVFSLDDFTSFCYLHLYDLLLVRNEKSQQPSRLLDAGSTRRRSTFWQQWKYYYVWNTTFNSMNLLADLCKLVLELLLAMLIDPVGSQVMWASEPHK